MPATHECRCSTPLLNDELLDEEEWRNDDGLEKLLIEELLDEEPASRQKCDHIHETSRGSPCGGSQNNVCTSSSFYMVHFRSSLQVEKMRELTS